MPSQNTSASTDSKTEAFSQRNTSSVASGFGGIFHHNATHVRPVPKEYDTAAWAFKNDGEVVTPNLAFLPILALFLVVMCSLLKAYKWSRENSRLKARGDVEIWDEDDVNYSILQEGDKNYLHVDIRGDGASLYDTVNSFGMLGNGNVPSPSCAHHPYQDSVTSYKSLLMQRADGSQYDSVKSYKAFLQRVTQNKDVAVEVKLLENYPIKSKSAEHFMVVEEESSEKPESLTSKVLSALPLRKQFNMMGKLVMPDKKKARGRCASGDAVSGHRKRSASNPTSRRIARRAAASSLPSIQCHSSSDSDEDAFKSLQEDRRRMWAERKKMYRSVSGSRIAKDSVASGAAACSSSGGPKRRRHFSADSARRLKKPAFSCGKLKAIGSEGSNFEHDFKKLSKPSKNKRKENDLDEKNQNDSETSENPTSSHSSCDNSDVRSDAIESYSNEEDDDTKLCTHLSNMSDDQTIDDNVFLSVDTEAVLSSSELLDTPPARALSSSRRLLARAKEDFFTEEPRPTYIDVTLLNAQRDVDERSKEDPGCVNETVGSQGSVDGAINEGSSTDSSSKCLPSVDVVSIDNQPPAGTPHSQALPVGRVAEDLQDNVDENINPGSADSAGLCSTEASASPKKVQRFHVTFVSSDFSSPNSE
ncbi:hypothetical protein PoB_005612500 [Plakobranchus ocellatus]|uniref:Uncharacterized protein n=1 Tax=Plakobranchus ocellatus TaxID=259542 RepID=A0AAV4CA90_9GAST|nr:hypothetical protein PoB_005612500 [Plakobranchus ocellatus]